MSVRDIALAIHVLGVILWVGGSVAALFTALAASGGSETERRFALGAARKAVLQIATPGLLLAWIGGLTVLLPDFGTHYARAGWMHGKLTLAVILTALTGVATGRLRKAASGDREGSAGLFGGLGIALLVCGTLVVILAVLKPF